MHNSNGTKPSKLNASLPEVVREGLLVDRTFLLKSGFARPAVDYHLRAGNLAAVARGVYRRPGPPLKWQSILFSLQQMGFFLHVGGETALAQQGYSHFLTFHGKEVIHLFSNRPLPHWLADWDSEQPQPDPAFRFELHVKSWMTELQDRYFIRQHFGIWDWPLLISRPELAIIEMLDDVRTTTDFERVDRYFSALSTLDPERLQQLLTLRANYRVARIFGCFAERHSHAWFSAMDWTRIDLGSGKRKLVENGRYNRRWRITVPKTLEQDAVDGSEQSIF